MRARLCCALAIAVLPLSAQQANIANATEVLEHTKAATVIVLAGEGAGRLHSIATGVVLTKDGVILTALHAVKGAAEVQVRTANGEVFDQIELLGTDERRDVAALKISAQGLPHLIPKSDAALVSGSPVYAVTNANGLAWSATAGMISAIRLADEIQGAGSGFQLLQFNAPIATGSSGGALVDKTGELVGIITGSAGNSGFAVPINNVLGLPESGHRVALGTGSALQMPAKQTADVPQFSAAISNADPKQIVKNARTIFIHSKTSFLTERIPWTARSNCKRNGPSWN